MSFIRLASHALNPAWIQSIEIRPQAYKIVLGQSNVSGWFLAGSGSFNSTEPLWITQGHSPTDYETLTRWIDKNTFLSAGSFYSSGK
ncbi:hypothetical protein EBZ37_12825 [bacterium]|nr:hypothetical protein [bacterium]